MNIHPIPPFRAFVPSRDKIPRALKQGMMQELLTGKTRLVSREVAKNAKGEKQP